MKLQAEAEKKSLAWKHFRNSSWDSTFDKFGILNLPNSSPELPIACCTARRGVSIWQDWSARRSAIRRQFDFLKNRFHSQLPPLNTHFWILLSFTSLYFLYGFACAKPHFCLSSRRRSNRASERARATKCKKSASWNLNHALIALNDNRVIVNWLKYYAVNKRFLSLAFEKIKKRQRSEKSDN